MLLFLCRTIHAQIKRNAIQSGLVMAPTPSSASVSKLDRGTLIRESKLQYRVYPKLVETRSKLQLRVSPHSYTI